MVLPWTTERDVLAGASLLGAILSFIPLCCLNPVSNIGGAILGFWTCTGCLIQFVDHTLWRNTSENLAPIWCEICLSCLISRRFYVSHKGLRSASAIRIGWMGSIGINTANMTIAHRTALLVKAATQGESLSTSMVTSKRRVILVDLSIALVLPLLQLLICRSCFSHFLLSLHPSEDYFLQAHRFDIYEDVGCQPATPNTILAVFLFTAWPIPIGLVTAAYCVVILRMLRKQRNTLDGLIQSHSQAARYQYYRVVAMCITGITFTIPLYILAIYHNMTGKIYPWKGLEDLHRHYAWIGRYTVVEWILVGQTAIEFNEWTTIGCSIMYFLFFGTSKEARRRYKNIFKSLVILTCGAKYVSSEHNRFQRPGVNARPMSTRYSTYELHHLDSFQRPSLGTSSHPVCNNADRERGLNHSVSRNEAVTSTIKEEEIGKERAGRIGVHE